MIIAIYGSLTCFQWCYMISTNSHTNSVRTGMIWCLYLTNRKLRCWAVGLIDGMSIKWRGWSAKSLLLTNVLFVLSIFGHFGSFQKDTCQ